MVSCGQDVVGVDRVPPVVATFVAVISVAVEVVRVVVVVVVQVVVQGLGVAFWNQSHRFVLQPDLLAAGLAGCSPASDP